MTDEQEVVSQDEVELTPDAETTTLKAVATEPMLPYHERLKILRDAVDEALANSTPPVEIEAGKTYAIRSRIPMSPMVAEAFVNEFKSVTNAVGILFDDSITNIEEIVLNELKSQIVSHLREQLPYFTNNGNGLVDIETVIDVIEGRQGVVLKKAE